MPRAIVIVLDSFGIGAAIDAYKYGDEGANTFLHIAQACAKGQCELGRSGKLKLSNMQALGLSEAGELSCAQKAPLEEKTSKIVGAYGFAKELSVATDTPSGHWEMMGVPVLFDWGYFTDKQQSFPDSLIAEFIQQADLPGVLGNCHASGTQILQELGEQHLSSGKPICYTSADSVFQIACHEQLFTPKRLDHICKVARKLVSSYNIARVISRPFAGQNSLNFQRTAGRRDYSLPPPSATVLDKLKSNGGTVVSIGKIADIFAHQGISRKRKADGLQDLLDCTLDEINRCEDNSIIFTNLVDFDTLYGHRRDINGYACALELFDQRLPEIIAAMQDEDLLILSADHGCDPSWPGTDHTRENVPVLAYGHGVSAGSIGARDSFADIGQSLASLFELSAMDVGTSFLN